MAVREGESDERQGIVVVKFIVVSCPEHFAALLLSYFSRKYANLKSVEIWPEFETEFSQRYGLGGSLVCGGRIAFGR